MDGREIANRRGWARVAGLMFWLVFVFDFAGMSIGGNALSHWLSLIGGLLTIPLAYGLYVTVAPLYPGLAGMALGLRGIEILLTVVSVLAGFPSVRRACLDSEAGRKLLDAAAWSDRTSFAAFVFTIASTIFFLLFLRSRIIPRVLAAWGLFASCVALLACSIHLVRPAVPALSMAAWAPMLTAETSTGAWMLIASVRYAVPLQETKAAV